MLYNLFENRDFVSVFAVALLAEGVDRNLCWELKPRTSWKSPSSRRAWIEICTLGCADGCTSVALLAEGVDRNNRFTGTAHTPEVALLAEGVDRNLGHEVDVPQLIVSPSSRRAWIEISISPAPGATSSAVALLAEGVDRNRSSSNTPPARPCRPPRGGRG